MTEQAKTEQESITAQATQQEMQRFDKEWDDFWDTQKKYRTPNDKRGMKIAFKAGFNSAVKVIGED